MKKLTIIILFILYFAFAFILSAEEKPKEWSEYQGKFSWKGADIKCESIGMRLPTIQELKAAYNAKLPKSWNENGDYYWTYYEHTRGFDDAYSVNMISGEHSLSYKYTYKHVRCVR
jgi:di/tricarboxylate transporter